MKGSEISINSQTIDVSYHSTDLLIVNDNVSVYQLPFRVPIITVPL